MVGYLPASSYPFACNITNFISQLCLILYSKELPATCTLLACFVVQSAILIAMPFVVNIGGAVAYWSCFSLLIVFGMFNGTCFTTLYRMVAVFPSKYMASMMLGMGVAGLGSNLLRALTLASFPANKKVNNEFKGSLTMFVIAVIVLVINAVSVIYLKDNKFAKRFLEHDRD